VADKKATTITVETETVLLIRQGQLPRVRCNGCGFEVEAVALDTLGVLTNIPASIFEEYLSSGRLHVSEGPDGSRLACVSSLLALFDGRTEHL
jgi:hypothetical protein